MTLNKKLQLKYSHFQDLLNLYLPFIVVIFNCIKLELEYFQFSDLFHSIIIRTTIYPDRLKIFLYFKISFHFSRFLFIFLFIFNVL